MQPKMGRPLKSEIPRNKKLNLRLSEIELQRIAQCAKLLNKNRTDTLMYGISLIEKSLKK